MTCIPNGITVDDATRATLEEYYYGNLTKDSTQEDVIKSFEKIDQDYAAENRIITVKYEDIPAKLRRELKLKEGESIQRYRGLWRRATDKASAKWRQGVDGIERALEISSRPDNIIKTGMGTSIHKVLEDLGKLGVTTTERSNIIRETDEVISKSEIMSMHNISAKHLNKLSVFMDELLDKVNTFQKRKDPKGKAKIYFERFVPDFTGNVGMTMDMMVLYSDGTTGHFDFKTIYPYVDIRRRSQNDGLLLRQEDWVPEDKLEQHIPQLRISKNTVLNKNLSKRVEQNRIIPIHIQLEFKEKAKREKGANFIPKIHHLAVGEKQDPALMMLPVDEMTGVKELDASIEVLTNNIHNYHKHIEEDYKNITKRKMWEKRLKTARKALNSLIIKRDIKTLIDEVQPILKRYYKEFHTLENIEDEFINGKVNRSYLSPRALVELLAELESYHGILKSSGEFIKQIGANETNAEQYEKYKDKVGTLTMSLNDAIYMLRQNLMGRVMSPEDVEATRDYSKPSLYQSLWRTFSQQNQPAIAKASNLTQQAFNSARLKLQNMHQEVKDWELTFDNLSKERGISKLDLFRLLVYDKGKEKRQLHSKYKGDFWAAVKQAQKSKKRSDLTKLLRLKDDAKELRNKYRNSYILSYNPTEEELAKWDKKHDFNEMLFNEKQFNYYYQENDIAEYYTDGYKVLAEKGNEQLLEFWGWWQDKMKEFRELAGVSDYEAIPNNFLPWIITDVIDMMSQGTLDMANTREWAESLFKLKAYDQHAGIESVREYVKPSTGELLREIPLWFTQPARDKDGNVNHTMKSLNLLDSIYIFADAVYRYHHLKQIEPYMEAIKDVVMMEGEKIKGDYGGDKVLESGQQARKTGRDTATFKLLDEHINYHLYGLRIQDVDKKTSKYASQLKLYQMVKELGFAVLSPAGNFIQVTTNSWFEASKGYHFNKEHLKKARAMMTGLAGKEAKELAKALIYFIEPVDGKVNLNSKSLQLNAVRKFFTMDTAMLGYRLGEHQVENETMLSVIQNYGLDENGNIKRIKNLPKGTKSFMERASIKNDKLHIEGLTNADGSVNIELYTKLRDLSVGVARGIKGGRRSQDDTAVNYKLLGNLFMGFKGWMPGMVDERASPIRYAKDTGAIVEGKYTAWFTDSGLSKAFSQEERTVFGLISEVVVPNAFKLLLDVSTFGWLFKREWVEGEFTSSHPFAYKVNKQRARVLFENFKSKYANDKNVQAMSFEDFLDYKQGQMKSLAAELFIIISLLLFVNYMGGKDDDGERRFKKNWATRTGFRLLNRAKRELSFFVDFNSLRGTVLRQPIPQLGVLEDIIKWSVNTRDELGDFIEGEEVERDGLSRIAFGANTGWKTDKPMFYETYRAIPGHKFFQTLEIFEREAEKLY